MPTVAVLGASRDRGKYGNKSVRAHARAGWQVFPINPRADQIEGFHAYRSLQDLPVRPIDRVSVYVPPEIGLTLLDDISASQPREVWLNPGSESDEFIAAAEKLGLRVICACSIVDVGMSPAMFSSSQDRN
ncbi:MAG: CoA-binding protein [Planctomycetaceae bacterium]|nr:CoA-binding protein [Planctomycetaceae bacterium]